MIKLETKTKIQQMEEFMWRPRLSPPISPSKMETRHLFYTLRMIWNHTMPPIGEFQHYAFGEDYTEDYMKQAVFAIGRELATRTDIHPAWKADLKKMGEILRKERGCDFQLTKH